MPSGLLRRLQARRLPQERWAISPYRLCIGQSGSSIRWKLCYRSNPLDHHFPPAVTSTSAHMAREVVPVSGQRQDLCCPFPQEPAKVGPLTPALARQVHPAAYQRYDVLEVLGPVVVVTAAASKRGDLRRQVDGCVHRPHAPAARNDLLHRARHAAREPRVVCPHSLVGRWHDIDHKSPSAKPTQRVPVLHSRGETSAHEHLTLVLVFEVVVGAYDDIYVERRPKLSAHDRLHE